MNWHWLISHEFLKMVELTRRYVLQAGLASLASAVVGCSKKEKKLIITPELEINNTLDPEEYRITYASEKEGEKQAEQLASNTNTNHEEAWRFFPLENNPRKGVWFDMGYNQTDNTVQLCPNHLMKMEELVRKKYGPINTRQEVHIHHLNAIFETASRNIQWNQMKEQTITHIPQDWLEAWGMPSPGDYVGYLRLSTLLGNHGEYNCQAKVALPGGIFTYSLTPSFRDFYRQESNAGIIKLHRKSKRIGIKQGLEQGLQVLKQQGIEISYSRIREIEPIELKHPLRSTDKVIC